MDIPRLYKTFLKYNLVVTDSRKAEPGSIFFALKGERFDGNRFAAESLSKGSVLAVIDDPSFMKGSGFLLVDDALECLQSLATFHRSQLKVQIIAVTGSNGKTTTKELIKTTLSGKYHTAGTEGNLNNHIGVPLTLLQLNHDHEMAVIEMGANHLKEIDKLCRIASPDYGIITNIGRAHIEGFGSFDGIMQAKSELFGYLAADRKTIFAKGNDPVLADLVKAFPGKVVYYGDCRDTLVSGRILNNDPLLDFELAFPGGEILDISTKITGSYNLDNFLAAACIGYYFNVPPADIKSTFEGYQPGNMRSQLLRTHSNTVILDSYNANPSSMAAAIINFNGLAAGNKILILGEMLELGSDSDSEHETVLNLIDSSGVNRIFLVGPVFSRLKVSGNYLHFNDSGELADWLRDNPVTGSTILIKGSRLIGLEKVVPFL